jgi:gamma-glutamyltranspeptidase / glutathione hydrolase
VQEKGSRAAHGRAMLSSRMRRPFVIRSSAASPRPTAVAAEAMVATSQPLATRAGLRALEQGGNAVDAALAAAAVLCVTEPMSTGIGGDLFAQVWDGKELHGLDAAGPAPLRADPEGPVEEAGPRSVTVPGAVAGWAALSERFGRLGLDAALQDAISAAEDGFALAVWTAHAWVRSDAGLALGRVPSVGERVRLPELGATLRRIAEDGPDAVYRGRVAAAIESCTWLEADDLAGYRARWVEPLTLDYKGTTVCELPPPTQGIAALEGLGLLALGSAGEAEQVECVRLALADAFSHVRDGADVTGLIDPDFLARRRREASTSVVEPRGGTVYLCAVDGDRMAVSLIQSLYDSFGSGIVAPGTGIVLQNRGACFSVSGHVEPGRRPYHTIIPGMLLRNGRLVGPFGVVGGFLQAQAHVQVVPRLADPLVDPQWALDKRRFRLEGDSVLLEGELWESAPEIKALGLRVKAEPDSTVFGGGQAIIVWEDVLLGGSDSRKDGYAAGF